MTDRDQLIHRTFSAIDDICDKHVLLHGSHQIFDERAAGQDIDMLVDRSSVSNLATTLSTFGYNVTTHAPNHQYLYGAYPNIHCREPKLDIMFDLHTSLSYLSIGSNATYVNVDSKVLDYMFDNRVKTEDIWMYNPSVESYITHLCCRVIFDKRGCDDKYRAWIEEAYETCDKHKLKQLFELVFHSATESLLQCISERQTKHIFNNYITLSHY